VKQETELEEAAGFIHLSIASVTFIVVLAAKADPKLGDNK